jgi:hypothetical protein
MVIKNYQSRNSGSIPCYLEYCHENSNWVNTLQLIRIYALFKKR